MKKEKNEMSKIIDLFAGCGGLSTGFEMAGYEVVLAIEKDEWAAETYKKNHSNTKVITEDITNITNLDELVNRNDVAIEGIIGGPPCQGFSLSGNRDPKDPRNSLFMEFVRFVRHYTPRFFVMENVTGLLSMKTKDKKDVKEVILAEFEAAGYNVDVYTINAAEFGVPQNRIRVVFIGVRNDIPYDKNEIEPKGFLFGDEQLTIEDAIMDLPQIQACEGSEEQDYPCEPQNNYQRLMREGSEKVYNHIAMRHTKRLIERFEQIGYGQSVADVAEEYKQRKRGDASIVSGKVYSQNNMKPYPDKPSPTIPASFQSNFVHPYINRNYTAREGARLQSFPDTYIFKGKRTTMSWEKNLSIYNPKYTRNFKYSIIGNDNKFGALS